MATAATLTGRASVRETVRQERILTPLAFRRLLAWLDEGVDSHGDRYLEMRRRLVAYFDRRNRPSPDELADETFNRIARILEDDGAIAQRPPARYCYVVARFVLLEDVRRHEHRHLRLDEAPWLEHVWTRCDEKRLGSDETTAIREEYLARLDHCLQQLKPEQRELILEYYCAERRQKIERRREMARRMGITMNALAVRAFRIRSLLTRAVRPLPWA